MNEESIHSNSQGCHSENIATVETGELDPPLLPILKIPNPFRKQLDSKYIDNIIMEDHSNFRVIFYFLYETSIFYQITTLLPDLSTNLSYFSPLPEYHSIFLFTLHLYVITGRQ